MDDIENAIRRWWEHERPAIEKDLRKQYRVGALEERELRLLYRSMREAFIAGWKARDRHQVTQGTQSDLFSVTPAPTCTESSASWCPNCGDCTCPRAEDGGPVERVVDEGLGRSHIEVVHDPACPLHGEASGHGSAQP